MTTSTAEKSVPAPAPAAIEAQPLTDTVRKTGIEKEAMALVKTYVPWTAAVGLVPLPLLDMAALLAIQMRMLSQVSALYQVPFGENAAKGLVVALCGDVVSVGTMGGVGMMVKAIPGIGSLIGIAVLPSAYSAMTYALGRVFVSHFESGGTFLDFDPQTLRAYFKAEFEKAKDGATVTPAKA